MTDKELQKLGRRELLEMLLDQAKESERLGALLKETDEQLRTTQEGYERLRERLDRKDERIHELENTLESEREQRQAESQSERECFEAELDEERRQLESERERLESEREDELRRQETERMQFQEECQAERLRLEEERGRIESELENGRRQLEQARRRIEGELEAERRELEAKREKLESEPEGRSSAEGQEPGSIAEAALRINGVFEAAQRAADYYLKSVRELYPLPEGAELPAQPEPVPQCESTPEQKRTETAAAVVPAGTYNGSAVKTQQTKGPLGIKRKKGEGKGKTTLFFGWQHD